LLSNVLAGWLVFILCMVSGFIINAIHKKVKDKKGLKEEE